MAHQEETLTAQAEKLVEGFINHFWSADHSLVFECAERECDLLLTPEIRLVGRIDAIGRIGAEGEHFFADWKTASPRKAKTWKAGWRLSPQALTYGILLNGVYPDMRTFLVRQAFKSATPTFDYEWFTYTPEELAMWRSQVIAIGKEILARRSQNGAGPWIANFNRCFKYGHGEYQCPYFDKGCAALDFANTDGLIPRVSHLEVERSLVYNPEIVVLDATRIGEYLDCTEKYRKEYEENLRPPEPNEALQLGLDFHSLLDVYYQKLIKGEM